MTPSETGPGDASGPGDRAAPRRVGWRRRVGGAAVGLAAATGTVAAGWVAGGVAGAAPAPVTATGQITCTLHGDLLFVPPLKSGGSAPLGVSFTGTASGCTGDTTAGTGAITGGKVALHSTKAAPGDVNGCEVVLAEGSALPAMVGTIQWKAGKAPVTATAVEVSGAGLTADANTDQIDLSSPAPSSAATGSYSGPFTWSGAPATGSTRKILGGCKHGVRKLAFGASAGLTVTVGTAGSS